jgi:excinuclease ABC subunit C
MQPKNLPPRPGVYFFKDASGKIIYVGKAKSLRERVRSYFQESTSFSPKQDALISNISDLEFIVAGSELEALILEAQYIKKYKPKYNVALRDDKRYPFLKLTMNEAYPRLLVVRRRQVDGGRYFGPYQGSVARETFKLLKKLFPIHWKEGKFKMRKQPCLNYHLGISSAACVGKIDNKTYRAVCQEMIYVLEGNLDAALAHLRTEMRRAADKLNFEYAELLKRRLKVLEQLKENQPNLIIEKAQLEERRERGREIMELQAALQLKVLPVRIEGFDISNLGSEIIVASMVVFENGVPLKRDYRRFKLRSRRTPDDVACIHETVKRRYTGSLSRRLKSPDLILIDGGVGQLNAARKAASESGLKGIEIISLAKKEEVIYLYGRQGNLAPSIVEGLPLAATLKYKPVRLDRSSAALKLLLRVRDEAHRFAVNYQRKRKRLKLNNPFEYAKISK